MKFPKSWLEDWVNADLAPEALAERITAAGLEVDGVEAEGEGLERVLVAEVIEAGRHPDADRLSVCQVSYGAEETVEIVCGAPNVRPGLKTPLALPGTRLPNGLKLRKSKIRGVVSHGMLCSAVELGLGTESDGIMELADEAPVGESLVSYLHLPDTVFDVDITPNRGDCFSVLGVARDVAALTGNPLLQPEMNTVAAASEISHPVERPEPAACPRFAHRVVSGIDPNATSPLWMTERLRRSGLRAIHPVVDVTNYVMLELGQPLHAYDMDKLSGPIRPRFAKEGERVTLLDEREVALNTDTVVITDDSGPIGLAGIMGGLSTMVTDDTVNVFFEAAFWPQDVMAGRARSYGMHTDASVRFERGVDPAGQLRAVERAVELLVAIAGGEAGPAYDEIDSELLPKPASLTLTAKRLAQVLGADIPADEVTEILTSLGFAVSADADDSWQATAPSYRFDIAIEDDLVEEVARIYGYDRIGESTAYAQMPLAEVPETSVQIELAADAIAARDYYEVITYSFVDAALDALVNGATSALALSNPISSEMSVMRASLWTGMLQSASSNVARQQERVRVFEIGNTYHGTLDAPNEVTRIAGVVLGARHEAHWSDDAQSVDFFDVKADVEMLLSMAGWADDAVFNAATHAALQPGQTAEVLRGESSVGFVGKLHPKVAAAFELKQDVFVFELDVAQTFATQVPVAEPISKYPAVRRDIAVVVDEDVVAAELLSAVRRASPELIRRVNIFDVYRGPGIEAGRKSVALGLILQETSRTLVDVDADAVVDAAVQIINREFGGQLRD